MASAQQAVAQSAVRDPQPMSVVSLMQVVLPQASWTCTAASEEGFLAQTSNYHPVPLLRSDVCWSAALWEGGWPPAPRPFPMHSRMWCLSGLLPCWVGHVGASFLLPMPAAAPCVVWRAGRSAAFQDLGGYSVGAQAGQAEPGALLVRAAPPNGQGDAQVASTWCLHPRVPGSCAERACRCSCLQPP